jgi:hypothetical protein
MTAERILIPHVDDVGLCHGANTAFLELSRDGFVTCGSVMVPCPWFREIAEAASRDPTLDLGVHLTLNAERANYRWGPISTVSRASGLIDEDGYLWRTVPALRAHVVPEAAESEFRAQIDRALAAGIDVTHLDTHMGAALVPELVGIYLRLGEEYRLPVLLPREMTGYLGVLNMGPTTDADYAGTLNAATPLIDYFEMTPNDPPSDPRRHYEGVIRATKPGRTFLALHANAPGDIETIVPVPARAQQRIDEYRLFKGSTFTEFAAAHGVATIGMYALRDELRGERR